MDDLRLACRTLIGTPIVTAVTVISLALGIGANTAIFSLVNALFLRTLPVRDPSRLVLLTDESTSHVRAWSYPIWRELGGRPDLFEGIAAWSYTAFTIGAGADMRRADALLASGGFFDTLGVQAAAGRTLSSFD